MPQKARGCSVSLALVEALGEKVGLALTVVYSSLAKFPCREWPCLSVRQKETPLGSFLVAKMEKEMSYWIQGRSMTVFTNTRRRTMMTMMKNMNLYVLGVVR